MRIIIFNDLCQFIYLFNFLFAVSRKIMGSMLLVIKLNVLNISLYFPLYKIHCVCYIIFHIHILKSNFSIIQDMNIGLHFLHPFHEKNKVRFGIPLPFAIQWNHLWVCHLKLGSKREVTPQRRFYWNNILIVSNSQSAEKQTHKDQQY